MARETVYGMNSWYRAGIRCEIAVIQRLQAGTRGRGEVLGQAGVAKASAYHHNRSIKESKK